MDDLTQAAIALLRESPDYVADARQGAPVGNSVIGSLLSLPPRSAPRQYAEQAVREALAILDRERTDGAAVPDDDGDPLASTQDVPRTRDEIVLRPTGARPVRFAGALVCEASSERRGGHDSTRHHDLALYRTVGGAYVLAVTYSTRWQGEEDWTWVWDDASADALADRLEGDAPLPGHVGYPTRSSYDREVRGAPDPYAEKQERMLSEMTRRWHVAAREILDALGVERRIE